MFDSARRGSRPPTLGLCLSLLLCSATARAQGALRDGSRAPGDAVPREDSGALGDAHAWVKNQSLRAELELVDTGKWDLGGTVIPSVQIPIYLSDPFHADRVGGGSSSPTGYALEWRVGYSLGHVSFEPIGGISKVTGSPIPLPDGSTRASRLDRSYLGMLLRYTQPFGRISPFIAGGATYDALSSPLVIRSSTQGAEVDDHGAPTLHGRGGIFVRIAPVADFATAFFEGGAAFSYTFVGKAFEENLGAVSPYIGLSLMGSVSPQKRPKSRPWIEPVRDANEQAREDAPRVERACERGASRSCEALVRFWFGQSKLANDSVVPAVDALTQSTVGITPAAIDPNVARARLTSAWNHYDRVSFAEARQAGDVPAYEAYLARFPHGEHVTAAREALVESRFAAVLSTAKSAQSIHPVLDFLRDNPGARGAKDYLVERGVGGLGADDLDRLVQLEPRLDPRFARLTEAAAEERDGRFLAAAMKLPAEQSVAELRKFVEQYPRSKRAAEASRIEAERAFELAQAKTGEEGILAMQQFRERYPTSARADEAQRRERNLAYAEAAAATSIDAMWRFLSRYRDDPAAAEIRDALADRLTSKASPEGTDDYDKFLERYPDHPKVKAITERRRFAARGKK